MFQMFDYYACNGACILFLCVFETLALGWVFGKFLSYVIFGLYIISLVHLLFYVLYSCLSYDTD